MDYMFPKVTYLVTGGEFLFLENRVPTYTITPLNIHSGGAMVKNE